MERFLPVVTEALGRLGLEFGSSIETLAPGDSLTADLGLASLDQMKLTLELEEALGISVEEAAEFDLETVGALCEQLDVWVREQHSESA